MNIGDMKGLIFRSASGQEFGRLRSLGGHLPQELQNSPLQAFAEDECGNYFVIKERAVCFWDHETSEVQELASSLALFEAALVKPSQVALRRGQVKSIWVSPELSGLLKGGSAGKP